MSDLFGMLNQLSIPDMRTAKQRASTGGLRERDVRQYIRDLFIRHGLPASLASWAYNVMVDGASGTEMVQRMYQRPEFRTRFKALFEYQKLNPNAPAISPGEILAYEREAAELMRAAGMPARFYDHWSDFITPISNRVSMAELADRVNESYARVANAPRGVRQAFTSFFGPAGEAALASYFLDPDKALPALRLQVQAAETAGAGMQFGFTVDRRRAMDVAETGFDFTSAQDRFANLAQIRPMFQETVGEAALGEDLEEMDEGVSALFGTDGAGDALQALEQRRDRRQAAFQGGGGAGGTATGGIAGLGASDRSVR